MLLQEGRRMLIFAKNQTDMRHLLAIALLSVTLFATLGCGPDKDQEPSVACIWDHEYSAFPSIVRYQDALYVSFREGVSHIFDENGIAEAIARALYEARGLEFSEENTFDIHAYKESQYDKLAETVRKALDMDLIYRILEEGIANNA